MEIIFLHGRILCERGTQLSHELVFYNTRTKEPGGCTAVWTGKVWSIDVSINFTHRGELVTDHHDLLRACYQALGHFGW